MYNLKRVAAGLSALTIAAGMLAGCGGQESKESKADTKKSESVFKIGGTGPLTGDASSYGISVQRGAMIAIDEINEAGGLNGIKYSFDMKDDRATAEDAATGYDYLMDDGMQISIGSVTSGSCESFASKSVDDNLFFMTPSASAANVIEGRKNAFRVCFGDPDQGTLAAKELSGQYDSIGAIYDTSDNYSSGIFEAFKEEMGKLGTEFITQSFDAENKKDFSTQIEALKNCDVIFLPIYYTEAGLIAKTCSTKGCKALIFGCDGLDGVVDQIDDTVINTIKYITPFDVNSSDEVTSKFVAEYKKQYNDNPDQFAADGYDAIYAIFNAMKAAGCEDTTISASDLCDKVVAAITDSSFSYHGVTGVMTWDESGACTKEPQIVEIKK